MYNSTPGYMMQNPYALPNIQQPQQFQQPNFMQNQQQFQNQPAQERRTNADFIYVSNIQQVREHIVQPNQMLYFMNNNEPEFYIKTADNFGTTQLKAYRFSEIALNGSNLAIADVSNEITRSEFDELKNGFKTLSERVEKITTEKRVNNESDYANVKFESDKQNFTND